MSLAPRYGGPAVIVIDGDAKERLEPVVRQRRRLQGALEAMPAAAWHAPSRCAGWTTKDVVAHLTGVNRFWTASVRAGLAGAPTRFLAEFDPVATPEWLVAPTRSLTPRHALEGFVASNDEFLGALEDLDDRGWSAVAEAPPGDLPVGLLASHALRDAWVHERDVLLPLGGTQPLHADEVACSLRYVSALVVAAALLAGEVPAGDLRVEAVGPLATFELEVGECVTVREVAAAPGREALRGSAVALVEALSTRAPFPDVVPAHWSDAMRTFVGVFATTT